MTLNVITTFTFPSDVLLLFSVFVDKKLSFPMISSTRVRELIADDIVRGFEIIEFDSAEDFTQYQQATEAPVIAMLANETKSRQEEIWNKVTEGSKKYSGEITISSLSMIVYV